MSAWPFAARTPAAGEAASGEGGAPRAAAAHRGSTWRAALKRRWQALSPKEQRMVGLMAAVLLLAAVWLVALQPALRSVRELPARIAVHEARLQSMQAMAAEAAALRSATPVGTGQSAAALNAATEALGPRGRLTIQGDRATLALSGVDAPALEQWLRLARSAARARPVEAQLSRGSNGYTGTLVVLLAGSP